MSLTAPMRRPLGPMKAFIRHSRQQRICERCLATQAHAPRGGPREVFESRAQSLKRKPPHKDFASRIQNMKSPYRILNDTTHKLPPIKAIPSPPSVARKYPFPLQDWQNLQLPTLDPTSSRTRLFAKDNPDSPKPGDILLATFKTGDPFSGVCLSIRRRGLDTSILLRNRLLQTPVEMYVKIYSPNVKAIEVVKRAERRARRARLYYMRKPKHDRGSVEGVVEEYLRKRRLIRSGALGVQNPDMARKNPQQAKAGVKAK